MTRFNRGSASIQDEVTALAPPLPQEPLSRPSPFERRGQGRPRRGRFEGEQQCPGFPVLLGGRRQRSNLTLVGLGVEKIGADLDQQRRFARRRSQEVNFVPLGGADVRGLVAATL